VHLAAQARQAEALRNVCRNLQATLPQHEKALSNLHKALGPLKVSVDVIVALRNYSIMGKKPLQALGNSFIGFQKSLQEVREFLWSAQISFNRISKIQTQDLIPATEDCLKTFKAELVTLEQKKKHDRYTLYCLLGVFVLAGLGLFSNGVYLCCRKEPV
jgi:hypothetical protein